MGFENLPNLGVMRPEVMEFRKGRIGRGKRE